jgi:hypothetical protein
MIMRVLMMTTTQAFSEFTPEEIAVIQRVLGDLGIDLTPITKTHESKVVRITTTCRFCKFSVTQLFQMTKYSNGVWISNEELFDESVHIDELIQSEFTCCYICKDLIQEIKNLKAELEERELHEQRSRKRMVRGSKEA